MAAAACRQEPSGTAGPRPLLLASITAGYHATCGIGLDGTAYCWGNGRYGQLGLDSTEECSSVPGEDPCVATPAPVATTLKVTSIDAGGVHVCAVTPAGTAHCWGDDRFGQLGTPDTAELCGYPPGPCARAPQSVSLSGVLAISAGDSHTCATLQGSAYCWGYGAYGRLGSGSSANAEEPALVSGGVLFRAVVTGGSFSCGIAASDSTAYCWGYNHLGQLGDGGTAANALPAPVTGARRFGLLTAGTAHACGLTASGEAYCWGGADQGELGITDSTGDCGGYACSTRPVLVSGGLRFTALAAGHAFTCGATATASLCWGALPGIAGAGPRVPTPFGTEGTAGGPVFVSFTAGFDHACGLTAAHEAYCWGSDRHGKLGDGPDVASGGRPVLVVAPDSSTAAAP